MTKKLLAILIMAVLCGAIPVADSFADCPAGYSEQPATPWPNGYLSSYEYHSHDGTRISNPSNDLAAGEFKQNMYANSFLGTFKAIASCNGTTGPGQGYYEYNDTFTNSVSGGNCWCKFTTWTPDGGTAKNITSPWSFLADMDTLCAARCTEYCGNLELASRIEPECAANTITINWKNATGATGSSTSCTYDDTLTAPAAAPEKRGYTFTGWVAQ